jgi:hypothetical protein
MSFQVAHRSHRCEPESCWRVDAGQLRLQPISLRRMGENIHQLAAKARAEVPEAEPIARKLLDVIVYDKDALATS